MKTILILTGIAIVLSLIYLGFRIFRAIKNEIECNCTFHVPVNYGLHYRCKKCKRKTR